MEERHYDGVNTLMAICLCNYHLISCSLLFSDTSLKYLTGQEDFQGSLSRSW